MIKEFKNFISKGNVIDLAIGVIIGAAFGKIVTSLVEDVLMPLIGVLIGGLDFTAFNFTIDDAVIKYGMFIQNIVNFLIVSFCIFIMIKLISKFKTKKEKEIIKTKSEEVLLLTEIRDLLSKKNTQKKKTISKKK